jgi:hypothetical protein
MQLIYEKDSERSKIENKYSHLIKEDFSFSKKVTYVGNKKTPFLRLYRYKEAFSQDLVNYYIKKFELGHDDYVFDPFSGMGTTLYSSMLKGIPSIGIDRLPLAVFLSNTFPKFYEINPGQLIEKYNYILSIIDQITPSEIADDVKIMKGGFDEHILIQLRKIKATIETMKNPYHDIFQLLLLSILTECSYTAKDGQYLRYKKDKIIPEPLEALKLKINQAEEDLIKTKNVLGKNEIDLKYIPMTYLGDIRNLSNIPFNKKPTAIITSPPYPNRYDYSRIYSVELCFNFVKNFEELKDIRFDLLRSHIEVKIEKEEVSSHPCVKEVLRELENKKLNNKKIPDLINGYFIDMEIAIQQMGEYMADKAKIVLVVDNVRFEGEVIPVDLILSDFAGNNGFETKEILVSRYKGNSSQQMGRYGRVPVRESILLWER